MSLKVLVIPEDHAKDRFVLKPMVEQMLAATGWPRAKVQVHQPRPPKGVDAITAEGRLAEIREQNRQADLLVLCVDRDGVASRRELLDKREEWATTAGFRLIAEQAWQETEIWILAAQPGGVDARPWSELRDIVDFKELVYRRYAEGAGLAGAVGEGRKRLCEAINAAGYNRIRGRCPEVRSLQDRIDRLLTPS